MDELLELLFEERRVGWSGAMPTARAARFMPFSQPLKKPCTAVSPRGAPRLLFELLLFDELLLLLPDELLEEFEEEFELLLLEELLDELLDELEDEFELPLELLLLDEFELLLPALILRGFTLASTPCAAWLSSFTSGRLCAWAPWLPTTLATAVTMAPMLFFMTVLLRSGLKKPGHPPPARPESDATTP
ncbi:hypothetical protein [Hydrogenophaga sp. RAC07]|uniref:hypothetical protein n=1 Tax=Hydrogenophaga sp. RAC07 TaxID=1842537 RepID=UPI00155FE252|nr:hypothetical protein [Hydrogenophaga sp. RAC07]